MTMIDITGELINYIPLLEGDLDKLTGKKRDKLVKVLEVIRNMKRERDLNKAREECNIPFQQIPADQKLSMLPKIYLIAKEGEGMTMKDFLCHIAEDICNGLISKNEFEGALVKTICGDTYTPNEDLNKYLGFADNIMYYIDYKNDIKRKMTANDTLPSEND